MFKYNNTQLPRLSVVIDVMMCIVIPHGMVKLELIFIYQRIF